MNNSNVGREGSGYQKKKAGPNIKADAAKKLHEMAYTRLRHPSFHLIDDKG